MRRVFLGLALAATSCTAAPATSKAPPPAPRETVDSGSPQPREAASSELEAEVSELPTAAGLHYLEIVTGGADPEDELPMLVAIHGLGDAPEHFGALVSELPVEARVILPRGLDEHGEGWSWFPIRARDPDVEALASGIDRAADAIAAGVEALVTSRPTRGRPVVTGFSQGGMLTMNLAVRHGPLFSDAVAVGGWLPPPCWPAAGPALEGIPPILALHGDADVAVQIEPTRDAIEHLQQLGAEVELHEYPGVGHAIPPEMRAELHARLARSLTRAADE